VVTGVPEPDWAVVAGLIALLVIHRRGPFKRLAA
jgi:hypothetical protein